MPKGPRLQKNKSLSLAERISLSASWSEAGVRKKNVTCKQPCGQWNWKSEVKPRGKKEASRGEEIKQLCSLSWQPSPRFLHKEGHKKQAQKRRHVWNYRSRKAFPDVHTLDTQQIKGTDRQAKNDLKITDH
jgi:hypothetical protein